MTRRAGLTGRKKPMAARCCGLLLTLWALGVAPVEAQTWTEDAVVRRALELAPLDDLESARMRAARGHATTESAWQPIELSYTREQTFGAGSSGEDYIGATIPLDLANRRGLRGEAWEHRALAAAGDVDRERRARIAEVRLVFHRVVALRETVAALDGWVDRIETVLESVRRREAAGDAARYERLRLERERAVAVLRRASDEAGLAAAEAALAAWLDASGALALEAPLVPPPPEALADALARIDSLPEVAAHAEETEAGRLDAEAASRAWVPDIGLVLGAKLVDLYGNRTDGFYGGIVLRIPLFDFASGAGATADAEADAGRIALDLAHRDAERAVREAHAEAAHLARAAVELTAETAERSAELITVVEGSYAGGEATLLELLDAHRGAADDRLAAIALGLDAWIARIALDRASGAAVAP